QVAVVGASGRMYRAVPFRIHAPSRVAMAMPHRPPAQPEVPTEFAAYAFEGFELTYPATYGADVVTSGQTRGAIFSQPTPFAALFVLVRRTGRYDLDRDAIRLLAPLACHDATDGYGAYHRGVVDFDARDLESLDIAGQPAPGK